jgi:serine protease
MSDQEIIARYYDKDQPIEIEPEYRPRVVVKFRDEIDIPYEDGVEKEFGKQLGAWDELAQKYPGITLKRLFLSATPDEIRELVRQALEYDKTYQPPNFLTYFAIDCPPGIDPEALARDLSTWDTVQEAYVEGPPVPPPAASAIHNPHSAHQGYLKPAPDGIDAEFARTLPGGDGAGVQFIDLEQGWILNHEDLTTANITLHYGVNKSYLGHGTAVLGQIAAGDNLVGGIGIAPNASGRVVSLWQSAAVQSIADAILAANNTLGPGDVLLIEAQVLRNLKFYPCEIELAIFDEIRKCTARGVTVVEAAGNGGFVSQGNDLDMFPPTGGPHILDPTSLDFKDSGAIMVGAASSTAPHTRLAFSNYGRRVDCYAWGENVTTSGDGWTGGNTTSYTNTFKGTSSAAPIIAGAAIIVRSVALANGLNLSASQVRDLLRNPALGTPSSPPDDGIGVMPDLQMIFKAMLMM